MTVNNLHIDISRAKHRPTGRDDALALQTVKMTADHHNLDLQPLCDKIENLYL